MKGASQSAGSQYLPDISKYTAETENRLVILRSWRDKIVYVNLILNINDICVIYLVFGQTSIFHQISIPMNTPTDSP